MSSPLPPDGWEPPRPDAGGPVGQPGPYAPPPQPPPGAPRWDPPADYTIAAPRSGRRWALILTGLGVVLVVAGVVMGALFVRGVMAFVPSVEDTVAVTGTTTVTLSGGDELVLYAPRGVYPTCDIVGPSSEPPDIGLGGRSYTFGLGGVSYESMLRVGGEGQPEGEYSVACDQPGLLLAPPLDVRVILGAVAMLGGSIGAVVLGVAAFAGALVVWLRVRARRTE